jgi:hypothetical protein
MNPENIHLPNKTLVFAIPELLLLLSVMAIQPALGMTLDEFNKLPGSVTPFSCDVGGSNCHNDNVISNAPAASSSRADSASAAKSNNNVKCFAFCLGLSTANSGSAADANSRTNSPGDTATAQPVTPKTTTQPNLSVNPNEITPLNTKGTQCIDNTGSRQDIGYMQGYVDGQRDFREQNGFDNSLHQHHTDEFKTGYRDGYQTGFDDAQLNVFKNPC